MGRLRSWVRRLERARDDEQLIIPQMDGTVARFPQGAEAEAFMHEARRLKAIYERRDPDEAHPLTVAKRNARDPQPYLFDADRQPRKDR